MLGPLSAARCTVATLGCLALVCGCDYQVDQDSVEDRFPLAAESVDLLWVVDNTSSMGSAQERVGEAIPGFLQVLADQAIDWQLGIVTTDMMDAEHRGRLVDLTGDGGVLLNSSSGADLATLVAEGMHVGVEGSAVERGLATTWAALSPPLATHENEGLMREGTDLAVIFVTDADDCSDEGALTAETGAACAAEPEHLVSLSDYLGRFGALRSDGSSVRFWALIEPGIDPEFETCGGNTPGERYIHLARATGGWAAPICGDMESHLTELGRQVAGRRIQFPLSRTPDPQSIEVLRVAPPGSAEPPPAPSEDPSRTDGWTYDVETNSLRLWGVAQAELGEEVVIRYAVGLGH